MKKINKLYIALALLGVLVSWSSCEKDEKEAGLTETKVYFVRSGEQPLKMYNKGGNTAYSYSLDLYKSGLLGDEAKVEIGLLTADELTDYNIDNGTDFEFLDPDVYNIERLSVEFSGDRNDVKQLINVTFDPAKLNESNVNKVLPVKIKSATVDVNKEKAYCIIHPISVNPIFSLKEPQVKTVNYAKGSSNVMTESVEVLLDIDNNDWGIDVEVELDQDYVNSHNLAEGTDYTLPDDDMFSLETVKNMEAGKTTLVFKLNIFTRYLQKDYMLPIKLKKSSKFGVDDTKHYVLILNTLGDLLPAAGWTIADFSSEEATGENGGANGKAIYLIDGNKNTFWHSEWSGGLAPLPHYVTIDMKNSVTVTQVDMYQRQSSTAEIQTKAGEFYISDNNVNWRKLADFEAPRIHDLISFPVKRTKGRYLKIVVTKSYFGNGVASIGEIMVRGHQ